MAKDESLVARALCQLLEADMVANGMDKATAKVLAGRACEVTLVRGGRAAAKGAKKATKATRKGVKNMGKAMKEANKRLRNKNGSLKKGKTQADVARLAHKIRRNM